MDPISIVIVAAALGGAYVLTKSRPPASGTGNAQKPLNEAEARAKAWAASNGTTESLPAVEGHGGIRDGSSVKDLVNTARRKPAKTKRVVGLYTAEGQRALTEPHTPGSVRITPTGQIEIITSTRPSETVVRPPTAYPTSIANIEVQNQRGFWGVFDTKGNWRASRRNTETYAQEVATFLRSVATRNGVESATWDKIGAL